MREYRGNTSVAYQLESQPKVAAQRESRPLRRGLPAGEKILYLFSVIICVALASLVLSRYAAVAELNVKLQKVEQETVQLQDTNQQLESEQKELKSGERIRRYAEDKGMILAERNRPEKSVK
ncbi:cell division protein FtsL [Salinithrix halophila]|uniref:Cell division protein FtsL n=1 Tax=Salinithrix halophila TaxID=1485204 RepID=A0ABV8JGT9_9BACL